MTSITQTHARILELFKNAPQAFIPGPELASRTGVSRTAVWKAVHTLRRLGYEIDSHPRHGYRLVRVPEALIPEEMLPLLQTSWLARTYHHQTTAASTNDLALQMAARGAPHGTVVAVETQTAGRGRLHRPWLSAAGEGLTFSAVLRPDLSPQAAPQITLVAAAAVAKTLRSLYGLDAAIKWPNDVLIHGKKAVGILTEMQCDPDRVRFLVTGIGINVNETAAELPSRTRYPATSIALELGGPVNRKQLFAVILHSLENEWDRYFSGRFNELLEELEDLSAVLGRRIEVDCSGEVLRGLAQGFTPQGALRILCDDGNERVIWVGDVTHVLTFH
ncbi:MAG: biotin--[acetyl-CoA-carboxylase] ligase [Thermodesulfobacteriota bacterium]|nr:biotin--[acetyl-CoA-carboxylase] ligase [Thermodesulfobacteriota bacterium]